MDNWLTIAIIVGIILFLVGSLSTFRRSAKQPLRKKSLNELQETLPRSTKTKHQMDAINSNKQTKH